MFLNIYQGEEKDQVDDKKSRRTVQSRPFLLRRSTATTSGSFKRRSLKLRRGTKDGPKDILDCDCKLSNHNTLIKSLI